MSLFIARRACARIPHAGRIALSALLIPLLAVSAAAQTATSNLRGYVRGDAAAPMSGVEVVTRSLETNQRRVTQTAPSGYYYLGGLRPGQYEVSVRRIGFQPQTRQVRLLIGQTQDLDISLASAAVQLAAVGVTAATDAAETRTSEVGTNITREQIENLPSAERNFLDIAKLAPGITATAVNNSDKFLSAGGQPAEAVNVFVDGVSYKNDVLRGGVVGQDASKGNPFPQGAVQEFRVLTQNYKAEYQKAASAIINATTRSGGNEWEGDFFANRIDKGHVAKDAIAVKNAGGRPNYSRLQAGGSIGGPLKRDKLFVFGTYEVNARDEPQLVVLGPSAPQAPAGLNPQQYAGRFISEFREHLGFGKLSWIASDRSTVDASLNIRTETDFRGFGGATSFQASENVAIGVYGGGAAWKYAGAQWLNEAQVNAQRFVWNPTPTNPDLIARDFIGIVRIGGREGRQDWVQDRIGLRNDVTRAGVQWYGDHAFKMGASVDVLGYSATKDFFFSTPLYRFRVDENWARPFNATFGFGDPKISTSNTQFGLYVQDDWNVTKKLVLNLGIRWDAETNMINNSYVTPQLLADSLRLNAANLTVNQPQASGPDVTIPIMQNLGGLDRFITRGRRDRPMYKKAFQPRIGASYDVFADERTVLFGGFGVYYDRNYWNTLFDEQFRRQYRQLNINFNPTCAPTDFACAVWNDSYYDPAQLRTLSYATAPEVFLVANDLQPPKTHQTSAGVRQRIRDFRVTASYNGIRGYNGMNFVRVSPFGGPETTTPRNYNTIFATDDRVRTWYDAMQLQVERPMRDTRWGGAIAYTLAKSEEQGQSTDLFWGFNSRYPTVADLPRRRAPGDQRHAVVANGIVRLPYQVLFSSIVSLGSGIALNATDASAGFGPYQQTPYIFTPPNRQFLGVGNVFAFQSTDARLEKALTLRGGQTTSIVIDVFNAFKQRNYGCYETTIIPIPNQATDIGWQQRFLKPQCAALGRRLQIGLRYGYRARGE